MKNHYTHLPLASVLFICCPAVHAQLLIDGTDFTNYGRFSNYGPYTEVTSAPGSIYIAAFGATFNHYETEANSLRVNNFYNAHGPGGSNDDFIGPDGLPGEQGISGSVAPNFWNLILRNGTANIFNISNAAGVNIFSNVDFQNGITTTLRSNREAGAIRFQSGAGYTGGLTDQQHVNGYVSKVGKDAFKFPVGSATKARPLTITVPASLTARIATAFENTNVENATMLASPLSSVFTGGSWDWIVGAAADDDRLGITVSIPNLTGFASAAELRLVGWNGTRWVDISGEHTATGNVEGASLSGTIPAGIAITQIGIGAVEGSLPVTLASFEAISESNTALLTWTTTKEVDSDYFEVQHSTEARSWQTLRQIMATGDGNGTEYYDFVHEDPVNGTNYYRLKMVDKDGSFAYSEMRTVRLDFDSDIVLSPNPTNGILRLHTTSKNALDRIQVIDFQGKIVSDKKKPDESHLSDLIDLSDLSSGIYSIRMTDVNEFVTTRKVIKN